MDDDKSKKYKHMKKREDFQNNEQFLDFIIFEKQEMCEEDREWCIYEADSFGEGYFREDELRAMDDFWLANAVYDAWKMYAQ